MGERDMGINQKVRARLIPTGECWCGCGEDAGIGRFFLPGHDRRAEAAVIKREYGSVAAFLSAHGYGPGKRNAINHQDEN